MNRAIGDPLVSKEPDLRGLFRFLRIMILHPGDFKVCLSPLGLQQKIQHQVGLQGTSEALGGQIR